MTTAPLSTLDRHTLDERIADAQAAENALANLRANLRVPGTDAFSSRAKWLMRETERLKLDLAKFKDGK